MSIKYAILGLLNYQDMHGYRIKNHIEKNFEHMWSINFGQIYPNLKELEKDGFIRMLEVLPSENGGPHKKLYSITDKGREEFIRWLSESPPQQILIRDPFMLRFPFFGFGDSARALGIIDDQIAMAEKKLSWRQKNLPRWAGQGIYVRLIAELGLALNEQYLKWLLRSRAEIKEHFSADPQKDVPVNGRGHELSDPLHE